MFTQSNYLLVLFGYLGNCIHLDIIVYLIM